MRAGASLAAALLVASLAPAAYGQAWSVPLGGRTASMGAGAAEGHDLAAPLINPAGIAAIDTQVFGLTTSVYAYSRERAPRYFAPRGFDASFGEVQFDDPGLSSSGLSVVPSGVGLFRHIGSAKTAEAGHFVLGLTAASPVERASTASGRATASLVGLNGALDRTTAITETSLDLYVGPVAGLVLSRRVRIGLSILGLYRRRYVQAATASTLSGMGGNFFADYRDSAFADARSFGGVAVAGIQVQPIDRLWLGLSAHSPSLQLTGSETQGSSEVLFLNAPGLTPTNVIGSRTRDLRHRATEAPKITVGLAYIAPEAFGLAADITIRPAFAGLERSTGTSIQQRTTSGSATRTIEETYSRTVDGKTAIDFGLGGEVYLSKHLAVRVGYSQAADTRVLPATGPETVGMTRRNVRTLSAGLGLVLGPFDTTFGLAWQHTTGSIDVKDLYGTQPASDGSYPTFARLDTSGDALMFLISATVTEEEARQKMLERVAAVSGVAPVSGGVGFAFNVAQCPKTLDASSIALFDYSALVSAEAQGAEIKSGLIALAEMGSLAARLGADLADACAAIAGDLGGDKGPFETPAAACSAARAAIAVTRGKLGPGATLSLTLTPAVCTVALAPLSSCLQTCGVPSASVNAACDVSIGSGVAAQCNVDALAAVSSTACALKCEARARAIATCTHAGIKVEVAGAADLAAANAVTQTLNARLPPLIRAMAMASSRVKDLPKRTAAVVLAVRAAAKAIGDSSPEKSVALATCITGPAIDFGGRVERLGQGLGAAAAAVDAAR